MACAFRSHPSFYSKHSQPASHSQPSCAIKALLPSLHVEFRLDWARTRVWRALTKPQSMAPKRRIRPATTAFCFLLIASLAGLSIAVGHRCVVPTAIDLLKSHKTKPDIVPLVHLQSTPFLAKECAWYDMMCHFSPCKQWGGEVDASTGAKVDISSRVGRILRQRLVGQELAISQIVGAMRSKSPKSPLSMHFVGDNGTGKTLAATLIQSALFVDDKSKGILYLRGNSYIAHESAHTANYRNELLRDINEQLRRCPQSLIIIDELQLMHRNTILVFEQFLDTTFVVDHTARGGSDPSQATFIFISDFGSEGTSSHYTSEELVAHAHQESMEVWKGGRTASLIQHIIPFMPATAAGTFELVSELVHDLFTLPFLERQHLELTGIYVCDKDHLLKDLSEYIWKKQQHGTTKHEQYRGFKKTFDAEMLRPLTEKAEQLIRTRKLYEIPRTEPPVAIRLQLCSNRGERLELALELPRCSDLHEESKKDAITQEDRMLPSEEFLKTEL